MHKHFKEFLQITSLVSYHSMYSMWCKCFALLFERISVFHLNLHSSEIKKKKKSKPHTSSQKIWWLPQWCSSEDELEQRQVKIKIKPPRFAQLTRRELSLAYPPRFLTPSKDTRYTKGELWIGKWWPMPREALKAKNRISLFCIFSPRVA